MGRDNSCAVVGAASSEPVFGNLARDYGVSTQAGNHNAIQRRHLNAAEMARETGHRGTVAVPTEGDIGGPRVTARRVCAARFALTDEPPEPTQLFFWQTK
jgi:hypothetical protein